MRLIDIKVGDIVRIDHVGQLTGPMGVVVEIKSSRAPEPPIGFISVLSEGILRRCLPGQLTCIFKGIKNERV